MKFESVSRSTTVFVMLLAMSVSTVPVASAQAAELLPPPLVAPELLPPPLVVPELLPPPMEVPRGPVKIKADDPRVREVLTKQYQDLEEKIPSIKDPYLQRLTWVGFLARLDKWYGVYCDPKTGEAKNRNPVTTANCIAVKELIREVQGKISWIQGKIDGRVAMVTPPPVSTTAVTTSTVDSEVLTLESIMIGISEVSLEL